MRSPVVSANSIGSTNSQGAAPLHRSNSICHCQEHPASGFVVGDRAAVTRRKFD